MDKINYKKELENQSKQHAREMENMRRREARMCRLIDYIIDGYRFGALEENPKIVRRP